MSFDYKKFQRWSQSDVIDGNALWAYASTTDTIAQITTSGFFDSVNLNPDPTLNVGDLIWVKSSDVIEFIEVTAITPNITSELYYPGEAAGANTALSNLVAVAINTSLISDADSTDDLGSNAVRWLNLYADNAILTNPLAREYGGLEADVSAYDGVPLITGGVTSNLKMNLAAAVAPGINDDSASGYAVGSTWVDTTADSAYACLDASVGAAVWTETTGGGGLPEYVPADATQTGSLKFYEDTDNGANYMRILPGATSMSTDIDVSIPYVNTNLYLIAAYANNTTAIPSDYYVIGATGYNSVGQAYRANTIVYPQSPMANWWVGPYSGFARGAAGIAVADETIYVTLVYVPFGNYDNVMINVITADVSNTATVDIAIFLPNSAASPTGPLSNREVNCGTTGTLGTTGEKTVSFASTYLGGWYYVAMRADNIGTALELDNSVSNGAPFVSMSSTTTGSIPYGYTYATQTSMPSFLTTTAPTSVQGTDSAIHCLLQKV